MRDAPTSPVRFTPLRSAAVRMMSPTTCPHPAPHVTDAGIASVTRPSIDLPNAPCVHRPTKAVAMLLPSNTDATLTHHLRKAVGRP